MSVIIMSRPCKKKCILKEPSKKIFEPVNSSTDEFVTLKSEEYECIRLIDLHSFKQEDVARLFDVARTTVQAIYDEARKKIADALINSKRIIVDGGDYVLKTDSSFVKKEKTYKSILKEKEKNTMRIAIPALNGEVFQHFGKTESFIIYDVDDSKILSERTVLTNGEGHCALASFLKANEVDLLVCGGIGGGALNKLAELGIKVFYGVTGKTDEVIDLLIKGELKPSADAPACDCHHDHEHEEGCHHHEHNDHKHECCHHEDEKTGHKCHCHDDK